MRLKAYVTLSNLREGPRSQQDLCISMHMDANNCVLMLNDLEELGYVERRRDPADRRRHIVEMTPAGHKAMLAAEQAMESLGGRRPRRARAGGARGAAQAARPRAGGRACAHALGGERGRVQASSKQTSGKCSEELAWKWGVGLGVRGVAQRAPERGEELGHGDSLGRRGSLHPVYRQGAPR